MYEFFECVRFFLRMGYQTTEFLLRHGYGVVFAWVFAEQMGIPVPALPLLLAAGASAGRGHLSFSFLLVLATIAAALSDSSGSTTESARAARCANCFAAERWSPIPGFANLRICSRDAEPNP